MSRPGFVQYGLAILIPVIGIVLGIIAAARDQVGPALALWMTSLLASGVWALVLVLLAAT